MLLGLTAALLAAVPAIADPSVEQKQSEARSVLAQIQQLDSRVGKAVESYNLANVKLAKIRKQLKDNAHELAVARSNLQIGQERIARRVVDLYTNGDDAGTVEVILGAQNLDDLLNRIDTVDRVSNLDAKVVRDVRTFRRATQTHAKLLRAARKAQERVVEQRAREKASVEAQLAQRQRLLSSIKDEIKRMQAAEQRRQLQLAREARARLQVLRTARQATGDPVVGFSADSSGGTTDETQAEAPPPPPAQYGGVVGIAMQYLGVKYVWGGASPSGFDCSGLVSYVYAQVGVSLPHSSYALYGVGSAVSRDQLEPGDLVFFDGLGHVGIYIGGGQFIHAPHTGDVVKISSLGESWYASTYVGARRVG